MELVECIGNVACDLTDDIDSSFVSIILLELAY